MKVTIVKRFTPVELEDENGAVKEFEIRELRSAARNSYMDKLKDRLNVDPATGNVLSVKKFEGMHVDLLTRCMIDKEGKAVDQKYLDGLPASAVQELYDEAQKINNLNVKTDDQVKAAKNGSEVTGESGIA